MKKGYTLKKLEHAFNQTICAYPYSSLPLEIAAFKGKTCSQCSFITFLIDVPAKL